MRVLPKKDQSEASRILGLCRAELGIIVPDEATEEMRDLERARDEAKCAERTARQQLGKFLLRHGRKYPGKTAWTKAHLDWIRGQRFEHEAHNRVLVDYLKSGEDATARVDSLTQSIAELVGSWSRAPLVTALQSLRGISLVSAVVLAAELGDLRRFRKATELMGYFGLVPSEHSSGDSKRQGRITRTGNGHARRIMVEAAWAYRHRPAVTRRIRQRSGEASPAVKAVAWKA